MTQIDANRDIMDDNMEKNSFIETAAVERDRLCEVHIELLVVLKSFVLNICELNGRILKVCSLACWS